MRNNKGFTLVELLAMLVVIGILMGIAIPNISGILNKSKLNQIEQDASQMVNATKIKVNSKDEIPKLEENECLVFTLSYLDDNKDIVAGPNGGKYLIYDSFVIVKKEKDGLNTIYKYYVRLVENNPHNNNYGIDIVEYSELKKNKKTYIKKTEEILGLTLTDNATSIANRDIIKDTCPITDSIKGYYAKEEKIL